MPKAKTTVKTTKKKFPKVLQAKLTVYSGANNTIFTLCDLAGNKIYSCSPSTVGFKNTKKSTPTANQAAFNHMKSTMSEIGVLKLAVSFHGYGIGGSEIMMQINNIKDIEITSMEITTNLPHNGTREKKKRRV